MTDILIVGAGGFGREVYNYLLHSVAAGKKWRFKGFLDDNLSALDGFDYPIKVVSKISDYIPSDGEALIMAIGVPSPKKRVAELLLSKGAKFESLIHPTAIVGCNVKLGAGIVVCPYCVITCDSQIGDFAMLNCNTTVGHDTSIGNWSVLSSHCDITGHVQLGEGVFFASSSTTVPSAKIGDWSVVGINSFVIGKIKGGRTVLGNPAATIK